MFWVYRKLLTIKSDGSANVIMILTKPHRHHSSPAINVLIVLCCAISVEVAAEIPRTAKPITVNRVYDGDTIVTSTKERVRLWGIDTPEKDQAYGKTATATLQNLLGSDSLLLETKDVDRYGRTIGIIYTGDGLEVNLEMVCLGMAWWYQRYAKNASRYKICQEKAQKSNVGLWNRQNPIAPWDWRRGTKKTEQPSMKIDGCGDKKYCKQMLSCQEAKFYLNSCGIKSLDGDKDGTPCEALCRD